MKFKQGKIKLLARIALAVALFAQGVLAAQACVVPEASASQAFSLAANAEAMPCHEVEKMNANACLIHCSQADQVNLDQHNIPALSVDDIILTVAMPQPQHHASAYA